MDSRDGLTRYLGQKYKGRRYLWQRAPTYEEIATFPKCDKITARAATLELVNDVRVPYSYLKTTWIPDDHDDYAYAQSTWDAMIRGPAATQVQRIARGQRTRRQVRCVKRWLKKRLAAAFRRWIAVTRILCRFASTIKKVIARLIHAAVARAWTQWRAVVAKLQRREFIMRRVLGRLAYGRWFRAAWGSWLTFAKWVTLCRAALRRALQRWSNKSKALAWRQWLAFLKFCRFRNLLHRAVQFRHAQRDHAFLLWRFNARSESQSRLLRRIINRMTRHIVTLAFDKWRCPGRPMRLLVDESPSSSRGFVEDRLRALEVLAKQLHIMRLQDDLGHARAVGQLAASGWRPTCPCVSFGLPPAPAGVRKPKKKPIPNISHRPSWHGR